MVQSLKMILFITVSVVYILSLSVVDAVFNRLVFREIAAFPYESAEKQRIYKLWEWRCIGVVLLIILPIILPSVVSYAYGGLRYLVAYWIALLVVQWDMVFGKFVFNDWWGDRPSIALPFLGWKQFDIHTTVRIRMLLALFLLTIVLD